MMITKEFAKSLGLKECHRISERPDISDFEIETSTCFISLQFNGEENDGFIMTRYESGSARKLITKVITHARTQEVFWLAVKTCGLEDVFNK